MSDPRTPREAKQQFLDDLIKEYVSTNFTYSVHDSAIEAVEKAKQENKRIVKLVAERHGLIIPKS